MVQNPPLVWVGGCVWSWLGLLWRVAGGRCWVRGGNCDHRAATRRRHAVAVRLMVQNPPLSGPGAPGGPSLVSRGLTRLGQRAQRESGR